MLDEHNESTKRVASFDELPTQLVFPWWETEVVDNVRVMNMFIEQADRDQRRINWLKKNKRKWKQKM